MPPVDYLPEARHDFDKSFDWYAQRSEQAAVRFASAVDLALSAIAVYPERFAAIDEFHRECPIGRFPFRISCTASRQTALWSWPSPTQNAAPATGNAETDLGRFETGTLFVLAMHGWRLAPFF